MSEPATTEATTVQAEAPAAKPAPKPVRKAAPTKKPAATKAKAKAKAKPSPNGKKAKVADRSMADVPASERRVALVKLLRKLGATGATSARPLSELADKLGYGRYDVYCLVYHNFPLAKEGFVKTVKLEEHRDLCAYLTAKGQKTNPGE